MATSALNRPVVTPPCATRRPNLVPAANRWSKWSGLRSPVSSANSSASRAPTSLVHSAAVPGRGGVHPPDILLPLSPAELAADPRDGVVLRVHHALLQRDDAVVGDPDVLGTRGLAARRDVAVA